MESVLLDNRRMFLAFLEKRVGDRALAEDLLQEAFARGLPHVPALASDDDESTIRWFYRVLRNAIIDHHRRTAAAGRALAAFANEAIDDGRLEPELRDAVCQCVTRVASTLKPEYAEALRRVDVEGVAVKDFASKTGLTSSNAGVRIFRARAALREQIVRSCGACATHGCVDCTCRHP